LFYWIEIKNDEYGNAIGIAREFQSLFYWIEIKNRTVSSSPLPGKMVSILVLLDRDKERGH